MLQGFKRHSYGFGRRFVHRAGAALMLFVAAGPAFAEQRLVLAYGDSLMAGYQLKPGEGFAPQLERALRARGHDVRVVSAAVSGDTTAAGLQRLDWVLAGLKAKPDLVILGLGANDMLRGLPAAAAKRNLDTMIAAFRKRGAKVLVAGMLAPPNLGPAYQRAFNSMYPALAKRHGTPLYPFFMKGVVANRALLLGDGMHPNPKGVAVIVRNIAPAVEAAL